MEQQESAMEAMREEEEEMWRNYRTKDLYLTSSMMPSDGQKKIN